MYLREGSPSNFFNEIKPDFHLLKSLRTEVNLNKNYRFKGFNIEYQETRLFNSMFSATNDFEIREMYTEGQFTKKKTLITCNNNHLKKNIKFFELEFSEKKVKNCKLAKEFLLDNTVTQIECLRTNNEAENFRKNYCAAGTISGEINIWDINNMMEEEPLITFRNENSMFSTDIIATGFKKNKNCPQKNKEFSSSLAWDPISMNNILEGTSVGSLNYWDIKRGNKIFKFKINDLTVSSLNWRTSNKNQFLFLSGNYISVFVDTRDPKLAYREVFDRELKGIEWLNSENIYATLETSGKISLKDIRFQKNAFFSKKINNTHKTDKIKFYQLSPGKKNLLTIDDKGNITTFFLHGFKIDKIKSKKTINHMLKDFLWVKIGSSDSLLIIDNNTDFSLVSS